MELLPKHLQSDVDAILEEFRVCLRQGSLERAKNTWRLLYDIGIENLEERRRQAEKLVPCICYAKSCYGDFIHHLQIPYFARGCHPFFGIKTYQGSEKSQLKNIMKLALSNRIIMSSFNDGETLYLGIPYGIFSSVKENMLPILRKHINFVSSDLIFNFDYEKYPGYLYKGMYWRPFFSRILIQHQANPLARYVYLYQIDRSRLTQKLIETEYDTSTGRISSIKEIENE